MSLSSLLSLSLFIAQCHPLLHTYTTVIELNDHESAALPASSDLVTESLRNCAPAIFIGGDCIGGLESLVYFVCLLGVFRFKGG